MGVDINFLLRASREGEARANQFLRERYGPEVRTNQKTVQKAGLNADPGLLTNRISQMGSAAANAAALPINTAQAGTAAAQLASRPAPVKYETRPYWNEWEEAEWNGLSAARAKEQELKNWQAEMSRTLENLRQQQMSGKISKEEYLEQARRLDAEDKNKFAEIRQAQDVVNQLEAAKIAAKYQNYRSWKQANDLMQKNRQIEGQVKDWLAETQGEQEKGPEYYFTDEGREAAGKMLEAQFAAEQELKNRVLGGKSINKPVNPWTVEDKSDMLVPPPEEANQAAYTLMQFELGAANPMLSAKNALETGLSNLATMGKTGQDFEKLDQYFAAHPEDYFGGQEGNMLQVMKNFGPNDFDLADQLGVNPNSLKLYRQSKQRELLAEYNDKVYGAAAPQVYKDTVGNGLYFLGEQVLPAALALPFIGGRAASGVAVKEPGVMKLTEPELTAYTNGGMMGEKAGFFKNIYGYEIKVNIGQQNKHIPGTNEYNNSILNGYQRSTVYGNNRDIQNWLDKMAGTGVRIGNNKERVDFGQVIGQYIDPISGQITDTTVGIIHYGSKGVHIVPARPNR